MIGGLPIYRKLKKLRVDSSRIYTTGLSYGGAGCILEASWDTSSVKRVTAIASLSPHADLATKKVNYKYMAKDSIPVWFWSGNNDGFTNYANQFVKDYTPLGGKSLVKVFTGGHCCWNDVYNGSVKVDWEGKSYTIYDWFLLFQKGKSTVIPPVVNPPVTPPCKDSIIYKTDTIRIVPVYIKMSDSTIIKIK